MLPFLNSFELIGTAQLIGFNNFVLGILQLIELIIFLVENFVFGVHFMSLPRVF